MNRDDNAEMDLSVPRRQSVQRASMLSRTSRRRSIFEEATVATISNEASKEITVQNQHSRHSLPDVASTYETQSSKHDTWYYSSNHVLVNHERVERGISPLHRSRGLDEKARELAKIAADKGKLKRIIPMGLKGNIFRGETIREIHYDMMEKEGREQKKILSAKYNAFGMGTHKGEDGFLYLVQLFEKTRIDQ